MSRASLRVGPTLGPLKRAMNNTVLLYKYFPTPPLYPTFEKVGISSNDILKLVEDELAADILKADIE